VNAMNPDRRWLLAVALSVSALVWFVLCWHRPSTLPHQRLSLSLEPAADQGPLDGDAVELEGRWLGQRPVVKHHPGDGRTQFFAQLDADGRWQCDTSHDGAGSSDLADTR